jgi:hypothetical protein
MSTLENILSSLPSEAFRGSEDRSKNGPGGWKPNLEPGQKLYLNCALVEGLKAEAGTYGKYTGSEADSSKPCLKVRSSLVVLDPGDYKDQKFSMFYSTCEGSPVKAKFGFPQDKDQLEWFLMKVLGLKIRAELSDPLNASLIEADKVIQANPIPVLVKWTCTAGKGQNAARTYIDAVVEKRLNSEEPSPI